MKTCIYCGRRIWPWQRRGFLRASRDTIHWHGKCLPKAARPSWGR